MANPDRLTGLDTSFLALEDAGAHMHVGSVMLFEGPAPAYDDFLAPLESRLHLVPRYRQKLAFPPLRQAARSGSTTRTSIPATTCATPPCPRPRASSSCATLAGRLFAQRLDRDKPLWELWLVDARRRRALRAHLQDPPRARRRRLGRRHRHRAVRPRARTRRRRRSRRRPWIPRPEPTAARCSPTRWPSASRAPLEAARARPRARRTPSAPPARSAAPSPGSARARAPGFRARRRARYNVPIGPHRRFTWVDGDLAQFKAIKTRSAARSTTSCSRVVAGALRAHLLADGHDVDGLELKAMVPCRCARTPSAARSATASRRCTRRCRSTPTTRSSASAIVHEAMAGLKESGQAVGAEVITQLAGFAPPTVLSQAVAPAVRAARVQPRR